MSALSLESPIDSSHRFSESVLRGEEEAATVENKEAVENV